MRGDSFLRFEYRLARELGKTHRELMQSLSWDELHHWIAFERIEPFSDTWLQNGQLLAFLATALGNGKKTFSVADIYPHFKPELTEEQALKRFKTQMNLWAGANNQIYGKKE